MSKVPSITLPVGDYEQIEQMNNYSIICVFRQHVLSSKRHDLTDLIPDAHTAYGVVRLPERIVVTLFSHGEEIFYCQFVPTSNY